MNNNTLDAWHHEFVRLQYNGTVSYDTSVILTEIKSLVAESMASDQLGKYRCVRRARQCLQYLQELANYAHTCRNNDARLLIMIIDMPVVVDCVRRVEMEHTRSLMSTVEI